MQIPLGENTTFKGIIDLIEMKEIIWMDEYGLVVDINPLTEKHELYKQALEFRDKLIENVSLFDDKIAVN